MIGNQLVLGRDLLIRGAAFQACWLSATAVAARFGVAAVGAHQIALQLWFFSALALDAVAIAAQSLVGAALGAGDETGRPGRWPAGSPLVGGIAGVAFAVLRRGGRRGDPGPVHHRPGGARPGGDRLAVVRGDAAVRRSGLRPRRRDDRRGRRRLPAHDDPGGARCGGFLPLIWLAYALDWGLSGIWAGLAMFTLVRLVALLIRWRGARWAVLGATR